MEGLGLDLMRGMLWMFCSKFFFFWRRDWGWDRGGKKKLLSYTASLDGFRAEQNVKSHEITYVYVKYILCTVHDVHPKKKRMYQEKVFILVFFFLFLKFFFGNFFFKRNLSSF